MKRLVPPFTILVIFLYILSSCEFTEENVNPGSYTEFNITEQLKDYSDPTGNIELSNPTTFRYVLYINDSLSRLIPANTDSYLINIKTSGTIAFNLKLFKKTELSNGELLHPPATKIFLQWDVVVPKEVWENVRVKWQIEESQSIDKAMVNFYYSELDQYGNPNPYSVDIFLNSQSGTKIASLPPGGNGTIDISFGYQVLFFRYWKSNPNLPNNQQEKGWVQKKPNGTQYGLVLNSFNLSVDFDIPAYFEAYPQSSDSLLIDNRSDKVLLIRVNGQLLEDFIILGEGISTTGLSFINSNKIEFYKVPIGLYQLKAIIPSSGMEYAGTEINISDQPVTWIIE